MKLICQICRETIGIIDGLDYPLKPEMFKTLDAEHKKPAPFVNQTGWRDMKCPYCQKRPFFNETEILTYEGLIPVRQPKDGEFICNTCGKSFRTERGLEVHKRLKKCQ